MSMLVARKCFISFSQNGQVERVLDGVDMSVKRGSIYCLMGSSGIGKTTLLSCILGMIPLDSGEIKIAVKTPKIGFMPQSLNLSFNLTIKEILEFYAKIYGADEKMFKVRFSMLENVLELPSSDELIENLSGGEKRRVSLAAAFIHDPELIILDEPTVGLDHILRIKVWNFFRQQVEDFKVTIILSTHYYYEANIGDRIGVLRGGKMMIEATSKRIIQKFKTESLGDAMVELHKAKYEEKMEFEAKEVVEDKSERRGCYFDQLRALLKKDSILFRKNAKVILYVVIMFFVCIISFLIVFGNVPKDLKVLAPNSQALNCSSTYGKNQFNIPCLFIDEVKEMSYFQLVHDHQSRNIFAELKFKENGQLLGCEEAFEFLDIFEMKNPFVVFEFRDKSYTNELYKNFLFLAYQQMTSKIFNECDYQISGKVLNAVDMKGEKIKIKYNESGFYSISFVILLVIFPFFFVTQLTQNDIHGSTWNQIILSGVSPFQIHLSNFITYLPVMIFIIFGYILMEFFEFGGTSVEGIILSLLMILITALLGILLSSVFKTLKTVAYALFWLATALSFICGLVSPLESIPGILRIISYSTPVSLPSRASLQCRLQIPKCSSSFAAALTVELLWIFGLSIAVFATFKLKHFKTFNFA